MKKNELSKLPIVIFDLAAMESKYIVNELEKLPENVTFKRVGDFLNVYD